VGLAHWVAGPCDSGLNSIVANFKRVIAERNGTEIVVTSAKRIGNKWQVAYNTIEIR
jgi:hypothetical protein